MLGASRDGEAKADKEKIRAKPEEHAKGSNEKTKKKDPVYPENPENPVKNSDSAPSGLSFVTFCKKSALFRWFNLAPRTQRTQRFGAVNFRLVHLPMGGDTAATRREFLFRGLTPFPEAL